MHALYVTSVFLHLLAAATWVGGMIFLGLVVVPVLRREPYAPLAPKLIYATGLRFRVVGWVAIATLLVTGTINLGFRGFGWADLFSGALFQGPFGHTLAGKLALVLLIVAITLWHDLVVGPRVTAAWEQSPDSEEVRRLRKRASLVGRVTVLLSLVVLLLAVGLVRGL